jgi:exonuclease III
MEASNVLFWNVRGLNGLACQVVVRNLVCSSRSDIVCLQETKIEELSRIVVLQILGLQFSNYVCLPSVGASGGILVAWKDGLGPISNFRIDVILFWCSSAHLTAPLGG